MASFRQNLLTQPIGVQRSQPLFQIRVTLAHDIDDSGEDMDSRYSIGHGRTWKGHTASDKMDWRRRHAGQAYRGVQGRDEWGVSWQIGRITEGFMLVQSRSDCITSLPRAPAKLRTLSATTIHTNGYKNTEINIKYVHNIDYWQQFW